MRSILLCVGAILLLLQPAGAGVVVTGVNAGMNDFGGIGTAPRLNDLGGFERFVNDSITLQPSPSLQDSAMVPQAFIAASGLFTTQFTYGAQNDLQELVASGLAVTIASSTSSAISTYAQMLPSVVVNFTVAGAPVMYSVTGTTSASGGGQTQVILVQLGSVVDTDIFRLQDPGLFSRTGQLPLGDYQLLYLMSAGSDLSGIGSVTSTANIGADITFTPEPVSLLLLGVGAIGLIFRRRR